MKRTIISFLFVIVFVTGISVTTSAQTEVVTVSPENVARILDALVNESVFSTVIENIIKGNRQTRICLDDVTIFIGKHKRPIDRVLWIVLKNLSKIDSDVVLSYTPSVDGFHISYDGRNTWYYPEEFWGDGKDPFDGFFSEKEGEREKKN